MVEPEDPNAQTEHHAEGRRIATWLRAAGLVDVEMAVDLADTFHAAGRARQLLDEAIACDAALPEGADLALAKVTEVRAWLFGEMKPHLEDLQRSWGRLEARLASLGTEDP